MWRLWCRAAVGGSSRCFLWDMGEAAPSWKTAGFREPGGDPRWSWEQRGEASGCQAPCRWAAGESGTHLPSLISAGFLVLRFVLLPTEGSGSFHNPQSFCVPSEHLLLPAVLSLGPPEPGQRTTNS